MQSSQAITDLQNQTLFADLPEEAIHRIAQSAILRNYSAGNALFDQEEGGEALYLIVSGEIGIEHYGALGQERVINQMYAPCIVGEVAVLTHVPRTATARCLTAVRCYVIYRDIFKELSRKYPQILWNLASILAERLTQTNRDLTMRTFANAETWIAYTLHSMFEERHRKNVPKHNELPVTHADLARRSGNSRETITRTLKKLEEVGVVKTHPRMIKILNADELEALANDLGDF
ncbi:Crp/Fnr family transcriptional regulator [Deinococcus roseus]|uniref:Crp/Fnr family transcriptional regulator n=1 Tax=Deinococcus roseus TaxID=392414 RepID=A0ABQ2CTT9_9DEIO|nr:Crp/Fnr family transcriptional regulator [Deinococcus roseus]GGJ19788.1 hypothetical protein GCM10008938_02400 [Deinococcus roseus]